MGRGWDEQDENGRLKRWRKEEDAGREEAEGAGDGVEKKEMEKQEGGKSTKGKNNKGEAE